MPLTYEKLSLRPDKRAIAGISNTSLLLLHETSQLQLISGELLPHLYAHKGICNFHTLHSKRPDFGD